MKVITMATILITINTITIIAITIMMITLMIKTIKAKQSACFTSKAIVNMENIAHSVMN